MTICQEKKQCGKWKFFHFFILIWIHECFWGALTLSLFLNENKFSVQYSRILNLFDLHLCAK